MREASQEGKISLRPDQIRTIFSDVEVILAYNGTLLDDLKPRIEQWRALQVFGDIFLRVVVFLKVYTQYVKNYQASLELLIQLKENKQFSQLLKELEAHPDCAGMSIGSYLICPVQRIPRYSLLLADLVKNTWPTHPDYETLCQVLKQIQEIASYVNEKKREAENLAKVVEIQNNLLKCEKIAEPHRRFVKEGPLTIVKEGLPQVRMFYLFNDILIGAKPATGIFQKKDIYSMKNFIKLNSVELNTVLDKPDKTSPRNSLNSPNSQTTKLHPLSDLDEPPSSTPPSSSSKSTQSPLSPAVAKAAHKSGTLSFPKSGSTSTVPKAGAAAPTFATSSSAPPPVLRRRSSSGDNKPVAPSSSVQTNPGVSVAASVAFANHSAQVAEKIEKAAAAHLQAEKPTLGSPSSEHGSLRLTQSMEKIMSPAEKEKQERMDKEKLEKAINPAIASIKEGAISSPPGSPSTDNEQSLIIPPGMTTELGFELLNVDYFRTVKIRVFAKTIEEKESWVTEIDKAQTKLKLIEGRSISQESQQKADLVKEVFGQQYATIRQKEQKARTTDVSAFDDDDEHKPAGEAATVTGLREFSRIRRQTAGHSRIINTPKTTEGQDDEKKKEEKGEKREKRSSWFGSFSKRNKKKEETPLTIQELAAGTSNRE
eukprot:TRINITY_DN8855_c0_g1_i2.p1 TRINITY_DN8855_c0_g1~~TRINITY_DN8855_c0_g1_i2.p1  ORF type:complete len:671 (+),score=196.02 TRINITY_DN8855_c0_g1_i2:55-2013(+)